jgi:hypothetical protein
MLLRVGRIAFFMDLICAGDQYRGATTTGIQRSY